MKSLSQSILECNRSQSRTQDSIELNIELNQVGRNWRSAAAVDNPWRRSYSNH